VSATRAGLANRLERLKVETESGRAETAESETRLARELGRDLRETDDAEWGLAGAEAIAAEPSTSPSTSAGDGGAEPRAEGLGLYEQPTVERAVLSPEALLAPENLRPPQRSSAPEMRIGIQYQPPAGIGPDEREGGEDYELRGRRRRLFGLRKGRAFVDYAGECAVCGTNLKVEGKQALKESGWVLGDSGGLCPDCQAAGWEWSEGAVLPLRRSTTQT
jgi:hypothetical protein